MKIRTYLNKLTCLVFGHKGSFTVVEFNDEYKPYKDRYVCQRCGKILW